VSESGDGSNPEVSGAEPVPRQQPPAPQVFELRVASPVRALAIAAACAVAGAVVIGMSTHTGLAVLGWILLAFGVLLAGTAFVLTWRLRSTVRIDADGLEVTRGRHSGRLAWLDVDRVQESGHRLIVLARNDQRDLLITVPGPRGASYQRLLQALKQGLDASRGYGA
jgi:hypothetical protein